jgi:hypothetical protein
MTDAPRDANQIPVLLALSSADGTTIVPVAVNPTDHYLDVDDGTTGSDLSGDIAARDNNMVTTMIGVSSVDGITPVPVYADPTTGALLVKTS